MREKVKPALATSLLAILLATGCSGGSGDVLDSGDGESEWVGVYGGEGDILSVVNAKTCSGAIVGLTLLPDGNDGLTTEIWWEQAKADGLDCPYDVQCAPVSSFNANDGGSCSVFNLRGSASGSQFFGEDENGTLKLMLTLERVDDQLAGRLVSQPLGPIVEPHGEMTFRVSRCESLPCSP